MPIGRCTASGWKRPRNCSQSACVCPSNLNRTGTSNSIAIARSDAIQSGLGNQRLGEAGLESINQLCSTHSCEKAVDHLRGGGAGLLLFQSLKLEGELIVVEAQAVQDRCVLIPNRLRVSHDVVAVFVGLAVGDPRLRRRPPSSNW